MSLTQSIETVSFQARCLRLLLRVRENGLPQPTFCGSPIDSVNIDYCIDHYKIIIVLTYNDIGLFT